jgi:hypothetical protein
MRVSVTRVINLEEFPKLLKTEVQDFICKIKFQDLLVFETACSLFSENQNREEMFYLLQKMKKYRSVLENNVAILDALMGNIESYLHLTENLEVEDVDQKPELP